jgi:hypothetical protein
MKQFSLKKIFILLIFCTSVAIAIKSYADDNCCRPLYECGCNPLYCGTYTGQLHAGIAPIIWTRRGEIDLFSCQSSTVNPVIQLAPKFPKFRKLYKLPWTIGGYIGYSWSDNIELYLEFNYLQAKQKHHNTGFAFVIPNVTPTQTLFVILDHYSLIDGYIGIHYYWDRFCDWISPFVGFKVGFTHHRNVNASLNLNGTPVMLAPATSPNSCIPSALSANVTNRFFRRNTIISGGFNLGLDICFCDGWSIQLTGEFVASCGPRTLAPSVFVTPLPPPTLATNIIFDGIGTELRFPVTLGVKRIF